MAIMRACIYGWSASHGHNEGLHVWLERSSHELWLVRASDATPYLVHGYVQINCELRVNLLKIWKTVVMLMADSCSSRTTYEPKATVVTL